MKERITRRTFLKLGAAATTGVLSGCTKGLLGNTGFTTDILEISEVNLSIPQIPTQFIGLTLAFVSDIHHGFAVHPSWITRIVETVNKRQVDFVFLGGDYIWLPESGLSKQLLTQRNHRFDGLGKSELPEAIYSDLFQSLSSLESSYGTYGIMGNHDCWISPHLCKQQFAQHTGELLVNTRTDVPIAGGGVVEIYGSDDYWNGLPQPPTFTREKNRFRVFLTHNPDHVIEDCTAHIPEGSLALCGHTHGGQIRLPMMGALLYNIRSSAFASGLNHFNNFAIYTSRGIGVVEIPYRYNCPQEIVFITLSETSA